MPARKSSLSPISRKSSLSPIFVVLGGAGAMGRIIVRDLVETAPDEVEIVIADFDGRAARQVAGALRAKRRVRVLAVDVTDVTRTGRVLRGAFAILNACHHDLNLDAMEIALAADAHYCDLGGLFHMTRKQLRLHARFRRADRLALLGIGAAPGIVNVLARAAADEMERVDEIKVMVAGSEPAQPSGVLQSSYSLATILDEASLPAALFTRGRMTFVPPMSGDEPEDFPAPVGPRRPARTLHSEVATLPLTYRKKGIREVSFRIAFPGKLASELRLLHALGLTGHAPVRVGRSSVSPRQLLLALAARLPKPPPSTPADEYEILRVRVRGRKASRPVEETLECHTAGMPEWGFGIDVDTGCPPSIAMQLLLRGEITGRGVLPPERAVPPAPFFAELGRRGMRIVRRRRAASHSRTPRSRGPTP